MKASTPTQIISNRLLVSFERKIATPKHLIELAPLLFLSSFGVVSSQANTSTDEDDLLRSFQALNVILFDYLKFLQNMRAALVAKDQLTPDLTALLDKNLLRDSFETSLHHVIWDQYLLWEKKV